jgi:hypothetical protein
MYLQGLFRRLLLTDAKKQKNPAFREAASRGGAVASSLAGPERQEMP